MSGLDAVPFIELSPRVAADVRGDVARFGATYASSALTGYVRQLDQRILAGDATGAGVSLALARATVRALDEIHPGGAR